MNTNEIAIARASRIVESIKADIARNEKILANGGFMDADGDFQKVDVLAIKSEISQLLEQLARREAILADLKK